MTEGVRILGVNHMAQELGVTVDWLKKRAQDGVFPILDDGSGRWLFDADVTARRFAIASGHGPGGHMCTELTDSTMMARRLYCSRDELLRRAKAGEVPCFITSGDKKPRYLFNADLVLQVEATRILNRQPQSESPSWRRRAGLPVLTDDAGGST